VTRNASRAAPLIRRPWIYDHLPQVPTWFSNRGHLEARARFHANLAGRYQWEYLETCPYCDGHHFRRVADQERHGLPIKVDLCMDCALVFTNPRLSQKSLNDLYQQDYRDIERGDIPDIHTFMYDLQASKGEMIWNMIAAANDRGGALSRVVDIGCGEGGLLGWIATNNLGIQVTGYELNVAASQYGRGRGLDVRTELFTRDDRNFDVVMLEQVLEHMQDPSALIAEIAAAQEEGALLYIGVPGLFAYPGHYEGNFCTYLDYAHLYHFCLHTLERLVTPLGYQLVSGTESVHAVFRRTAGPGTLKTRPVSGLEMQDFFEREESAFRERGSHFLRNLRGYSGYVKLLLRHRLKRVLGRNAE
jgi:SAM-dependent methyltransferase